MYSGTVIKPYWGFEVGDRIYLREKISHSNGVLIYIRPRTYHHCCHCMGY